MRPITAVLVACIGCSAPAARPAPAPAPAPAPTPPAATPDAAPPRCVPMHIVMPGEPPVDECVQIDDTREPS
jgi:hypothetical protein